MFSGMKIEMVDEKLRLEIALNDLLEMFHEYSDDQFVVDNEAFFKKIQKELFSCNLSFSDNVPLWADMFENIFSCIMDEEECVRRKKQ